MISPRYTVNSVNSPSSNAESVKSNETESVTKSPQNDGSFVGGTEIAFNRQHNFSLRCYESIMPPPPHNMLNALNNNNNNNNTKSYNRNYSWNNQKKTIRDQNKIERQVTQNCDKETKTISIKKTSENKSSMRI